MSVPSKELSRAHQRYPVLPFSVLKSLHNSFGVWGYKQRTWKGLATLLDLLADIHTH
jgi:hypothetical protein